MNQHTSSRFYASGVVAGTLLCFFLIATVHVLRPDCNPLRRLMSEYLIGPFSFVGIAAVFMLAMTFLMLLLGLQFSIRPSGFLTASCVLLGIMFVSACGCAVFPLDVLPPDGRLPAFTRAGIIHLVFSALLYLSLLAVLFTLPGAYKRDEKWRPFSHMPLLWGFLVLASVVAFVLAPFYLRGLAHRSMGLLILIWLFLTGMRFGNAIPDVFIKAVLLFGTVIVLVIFVTSSAFRILSSLFTPPKTIPYLYWSLVALFFAMGTLSLWRSIIVLRAYFREHNISQV